MLFRSTPSPSLHPASFLADDNHDAPESVISRICPVDLASLALLWLFLRVRWDKETKPWEKLKRIDMAGNCLTVASSVSVLLALTWAGAYYPWSSPRVLVPLILSLLGFCGLFWLESSDVVAEPVMPLRLFANPTSAIIFINTFLVATLSYWI